MIDNLRRGSPLSNELKLTTVCFVIKPTSRRRVNWDKPGEFMASRIFQNMVLLALKKLASQNAVLLTNQNNNNFS